MRSDARKRLQPEPHHDPAVRELIDAARIEGRIEGWRARSLAFEAEARDTERNAAEVHS